MNLISPYDPRILKKAGLEKNLRVFLCGPGYESSRYGFRKNLREFMESFPNTETILGEELNPKKHGLKRSDLQTAELAFAQKADFTILLLESPGAIAELATFSMMENVRPRLFVMVAVVANDLRTLSAFLGFAPQHLFYLIQLADKMYFEFEVAKATGGKRKISAPRSELKGVQRAILGKILEPIPVDEACFAYVKGTPP